MRGGTWLMGAGLALALHATPSHGAATAEREPVTGGFTATPGIELPAPPSPTPDPVPAAAAPADKAATQAAPAAAAPPGKTADDTRWGVLVRGGYFGLPDAIADELFYQHPSIDGTSYGVELRYHGADGGRGVSSIGIAVDAASASTEGIWQEDENDDPTAVSGDMDMLAFSLTGYWSLFPSWYVHPYVGLGLGIAHVEGSYQDEEELHTVDIWVPVLHVPLGLAVELGKHFQIAVEARFIDGFALGGALQARF